VQTRSGSFVDCEHVLWIFSFTLFCILVLETSAGSNSLLTESVHCVRCDTCVTDETAVRAGLVKEKQAFVFIE
jgi:hypothetical protein